jgi:predicted XRE-type DNA-binding protein
VAKNLGSVTMHNTDDIPVVEGSDNIFIDLGLPDADALQMKAELTRQIYNRIKALGLTQREAGKRLGLQQPDVSKLIKGRFTGFSVDRLLALLNALDVDVEIVLRPCSKHNNCRGTVKVIEATSLSNSPF